MNLKPCPFCGSEIIETYDLKYYPYTSTVSCDECGCRAVGTDLEITINRWNKRVKQEHSIEKEKELQ